MGSDQKRAILAVVLSGLILFGWQYFFSTKTDGQNISQTNVQDNPVSHSTALDHQKSNENNQLKQIENPVEEVLITLSSGEMSFTLDNFLSVKEAFFSNTDNSLKT